MKTMYIECNMGAAGDMLMAALLELLPNPDGFIKRMNQLGIPGVTVSRETSVKCGITGTHIRVMVRGKEEESLDIPMGHGHHHHDHGYHHHGHSHGDKHAHEHIHDGHDHHHMDMHHHEHVHDDHRHHHVHDHHHTHDHEHVGMAEIEDIVNDLPLSDKVKGDVLAVYGLIAEAESKAHGKPVEAVHFHEVGMMDAVADIVGVCLLMEELAPQRVIVSPIHVGSGQVKCAHGILPVPAPATAYLLKGVPTYGGRIEGELCTPTGAALLKHFADDFGDRPVMATESIGYGMGKKDFPAANCVRIFLGETKGQDADIIKVECNLDDMTGEELGYALQVLMKKWSPGCIYSPCADEKKSPRPYTGMPVQAGG
ncbi:MAG: LarC family nickel insertion protein [Caldicoprobacterales bacterium]